MQFLGCVVLIIDIIISPLRALEKAEFMPNKDKTWSRRTGADTKTTFNCRAYSKTLVNNEKIQFCVIKLTTPLSSRNYIYLQEHYRYTTAQGTAGLIKMKCLSHKLLPASPLSAFSTATPLSSSCLCFSSTCSNCLWMICADEQVRELLMRCTVKYKQVELSHTGAQNNNIYR